MPMSMANRPKKRRYDLREYWPWYERNWPTADAGYGLPSTTPPPFGLGKISKQPTLLPPRQRRVAQMVCIVMLVVAVLCVVWGLFH
jgi:hypothetical protein